jgi:hypothetical protein
MSRGKRVRWYFVWFFATLASRLVKRLLAIFIFIVLLLLMVSCVTSVGIVDGDDLYFRTTPRYPRTTYRIYPQWGYDYGYRYQWYQDRVIIIDRSKTPPPTNYGKRPTREGNNTPPVRGGRSRN